MQTQININFLLFGVCRDLVGRSRLEMKVNHRSTVAEAVSIIREHFPGLERPNLLFAVNEEYVNDQTMLQDGDELAIFTAVSGG